MQAVLVVNSSLKMSAGKIGAQCAHAAVGLYKQMYINGVPWLPSWEVEDLLSPLLLPSLHFPSLSAVPSCLCYRCTVALLPVLAMPDSDLGYEFSGLSHR